MRSTKSAVIAACLLVAVLSFSLLTGCGGSDNTAEETVPSTKTSTRPSSDTSTESSQNAEVTGDPDKVVLQYVEAVNKGDLNAAKNLWSGNTEEASDWFDKRSITVSQIKVTGSGQTAYVTGSVSYTDDDGEAEADDFSFVLNKVGEDWKIVDED